MKHPCIFAAHMSPTINGSMALQRVEHNNAVQIHNGIMFDFYPGLPRIQFVWKTDLSIKHLQIPIWMTQHTFWHLLILTQDSRNKNLIQFRSMRCMYYWTRNGTSILHTLMKVSYFFLPWSHTVLRACFSLFSFLATNICLASSCVNTCKNQRKFHRHVLETDINST